MGKVVALSAFVLLTVGTLGLLANEFLFDWGRAATILFAVANGFGLLAFGLAYWAEKDGK